MNGWQRMGMVAGVVACGWGLPRGRAEVAVSGIHPHLAMYNNEGECGTGAVVPFADRLWVVTYGPHLPRGSSDKLYEITPDLKQIVRRESLGGTPANRMIHRESNQLVIGPHVIAADGTVRTIPYTAMFGRHTGNARHLTDPANRIYYATMEEGIYEVDVRTLEVTELWRDEQLQGGRKANLPGYHGKGLYSGQGVLVYANNGEHGPEALKRPDIPSGVLAEWDGKADAWTIVRRAQFTEVTGPGGIAGSADPDHDPIWAVGWDHRSLLLLCRHAGAWHTYRLPKGSHSYDGAHGWNTEWPRIRDIGGDELLMTMHGTLWRFPRAFTPVRSGGIRPRSAYLKVVGDFCRWNDRVVFGCDDSAKSEFLNKRRAKGTAGGAGQSNSNLWFVEPERLDRLGPALGRGAVWINDAVVADEPSDPFLFAGYAHRHLYLAHDGAAPLRIALEVDRDGAGTFSLLREVEAAPGRLTLVAFAPEERGAWIRLVPRAAVGGVTAAFHYVNADARGVEPAAPFAGLATDATPEALGGIVYSRGENKRTLGVAAMRAGSNGVRDAGVYELNPDLKLVRSDDQGAMDHAKMTYPMNGAGVSVDEAGVLVVDDAGRRWRLPMAGPEFREPGLWGPVRLCREVVTERDLFNAGGLFYELPAENAGGYAGIRPVTTHGLRVHDYASYRGLIVMTGIAADAAPSPHIVRSEDGAAAVWVGVIDDLWKLGRPRGVGGPWKESAVRAGAPSDPYLMTGFERRRLTLSHSASEAVNFTVELDVTGAGAWYILSTHRVEPGSAPEIGLDDVPAYWLRVTADRDCTATAWLVYE
jgi:hypothetical protein